MADIRQQLLAAFEAEHKEHVEAIRGALTGIRADEPVDMKDVFRHAHSLKGAARAVDMPALEGLAHELESVFFKMVEGSIHLLPPDFGRLHQVLDLVEAYVAASNRGVALPDLEVGLAALAAINQPEGVAEATAEPEAETESGAALEVLRVPAEQIDELSEAIHALARDLQGHGRQADALRTIQGDGRTLLHNWEALRAAIGREGQSEALSRSLASFEEQLRARDRTIAAMVRDQRRADWGVTESFRRVRSSLDEVSLIPAETVFGDLGRMTRTLARAQGLAVEVEVTGLDVRADRSVLQGLREPVIHALRNAIGHGGMEGAEARRAAGKPEAVSITLALSARRGELRLSIKDDGPGPNLARIAERARVLGHPSAGPAEELLELLFESGFSTAPAVDSLSGRGMGLAAVADAVRKLRGHAAFRATAPGAELVLSVPLAADQQSLLFVALGGETYAIPAYAVERLLRLSPGEVSVAEGQMSVRNEIRGASVVTPMVMLGSLLENRPVAPAADGAMMSAVLLRQGTRRLAVAVDEFLDVRSAVIGSAAQVAGAPAAIGGTAMLDEDRPVLVLNPQYIFDQARTAAPIAVPVAAPAARRIATVLVVDDSITTRMLEKSILEAQGYRVVLSVDGVDALTALRSEGALVDLVIADVEMPRLDGFGLLQAMKNDPRLSDIPVIMVTSREDPGHIHRGMELGAAAYLTKQKFDQRELLATIGQLL